MQNKKTFYNPFENWGQQMPQMPQMWNMGKAQEQASKNIEAMTRANQIAAESMQAIARRTAEIMQKAAQNSMECFKDACSSKSMEDAQRIQASFVSDMMHNCCGNARETTEMASKAAMEIVDVCNKNMSDNICEMTNCTTQHGQKTTSNTSKK